MTQTALTSAGSLVLAASLLVGSPPARADDAPDEAPAAAPEFEGWSVLKDTVAPPKGKATIEQALHAKLKSLRTIVYMVHGQRIELNLIEVTSKKDGDKLEAALTKTKPAWSVVRKGEVVYEFVGKKEANDEMKKASARLAGQ